MRRRRTRFFGIHALVINSLLLVAAATFSANAFANPPMVEPLADTTLSGSAQTFKWSANGVSVKKFWLYIGTTVGGRDLANSGDLGLDTEYDVIGMPVDGSTIHARLWYYHSSRWFYQDGSYTAANIDAKQSPPKLISPNNNSELTGGTATFEWRDNNTPVNYWWLYIGSRKGGFDLYNSGPSLRAQTSATINNLPVDGSNAYVRLWFRTRADGWQYADTTYSTNDGSTDDGNDGSLVEVVAVAQQDGNQFHLEIDQQQVATFDLTSTTGDLTNATPVFQTYSYRHDESVDTAEIRVDLPGLVGQARVREIRVDGEIYPTVSSNAYKSGHLSDGDCRDGTFETEIIHCPGFIEYFIDNRFDSRVEIVAVGQQGGEAIELEINGQQVATFNNLSSAGSQFDQSPAFDTYTYVHPNRISSAELRVIFNDQQGNVRIREVRVDGNVYPTTSARVTGHWNGECGSDAVGVDTIHCDGFALFSIDNGSAPASRASHAYNGVTRGRWNEINSQRMQFGDENQCQSKVNAIAESPDVIINSGDVISLIEAVNDGIQIIGLRGGTYPINDTIRLRDGQQLLGTNGETVVIDASAVDQAFQLYEGSTIANMSIVDARDSAVLLYDDNLIYRVSAGRTGYRNVENPNGTAIGVAHRGQNNCIVSVDAFESYNEISYPGSTCQAACANGGNADGIGIKFDAVHNTIIDGHAYRNSDDGYDFWQASTTYVYYGSAYENGEIPAKLSGDGNGVKLGRASETLDSTHYVYKTQAYNNNSNGFDRNTNTYLPQLVQTQASDNRGADYAGF